MGLADRDYMKDQHREEFPAGVGLTPEERLSIFLARWFVQKKKWWMALGVVFLFLVLLALILPGSSPAR